MIELKTTAEWRKIPRNTGGRFMFFCWPLKEPLYTGWAANLRKKIRLYHTTLYGERFKQMGATIIIETDKEKVGKHVLKRQLERLSPSYKGKNKASKRA